MTVTPSHVNPQSESFDSLYNVPDHQQGDLVLPQPSMTEAEMESFCATFFDESDGYDHFDTEALIQPPVLPASQPRTIDHNREAADRLAAYIVGCLALEGLISVDHQDFNRRDDQQLAMRIISAILRPLSLGKQDSYTLPFDW